MSTGSFPGERPQRRPPGPWALRVIGIYKLAKALVLLVGALVIARLDPVALVQHSARAAARLRIDPDNRLLQRAFDRLAGLSHTRLEQIGAGIAAYSMLYVIQGVGLLRQKRWAEQLVVVTTGFLIPFEVYELCRRPRAVPAVVLAVNVAIVAYLVARIQRERVS